MKNFYRHINPDGSRGGLVEVTTTIDNTAYIGYDAIISDYSKVLNFSEVYGNARIYHHVCISDYSKVYGNVKITGNIQVLNRSIIFGDAILNGNKKIDNKTIFT